MLRIGGGARGSHWDKSHTSTHAPTPRSVTGVVYSLRPYPSGMPELAIDIRNIVKRYAEHVAVRDLSLAVPRGAVYGLLGPNGAGKTTTIRMILNIIMPDSKGSSDGGTSAPPAPSEHAAAPAGRVEDDLPF